MFEMPFESGRKLKKSRGPSPAQHLRLFQDLSSLSDWSLKLIRDAESLEKRPDSTVVARWNLKEEVHVARKITRSLSPLI